MAHSHNIVMRLDGYQQSNSSTYFIDGYVSSTSFTTAAVKIGRKNGYSLTISCPSTGSPNGTVKLQGCNDEERILDVQDSRVTNWFDITGATSALSGASVITFEHNAPNYRWLRLVYTAGTGSITATIRLHTKQESQK